MKIRSVGWIDNIYNNTPVTWYLKSVDDRHNGALTTGKTNFTLDDGQYHALAGNTRFHADWCGIPWYFEGKHYKVVSSDKQKGVLFYTSVLEDQNWIVYEELNTGRRFGRQKVPGGVIGDFRCNLRFEADGVFIDVANEDFSGEKALYQTMNEAKEWVKALAPIMAAKIKGAA